MVRRLPPQSPGGRECLFVFFFCLVCLCSYVFPPPDPTQHIFHTPMTRYSLFVLKVSLNTNKTDKQLSAVVVLNGRLHKASTSFFICMILLGYAESASVHHMTSQMALLV